MQGDATVLAQGGVGDTQEVALAEEPSLIRLDPAAAGKMTLPARRDATLDSREAISQHDGGTRALSDSLREEPRLEAAGGLDAPVAEASALQALTAPDASSLLSKGRWWKHTASSNPVSRTSSAETEGSAVHGSGDEGVEESRRRMPHADGGSQSSFDAGARTPSSSSKSMEFFPRVTSAGRSFRKGRVRSEELQKRDQEAQTSSAELAYLHIANTPMSQCLQQICEATDFAYAEVWIRAVRGRSNSSRSNSVRKTNSLRAVLKDEPDCNSIAGVESNLEEYVSNPSGAPVEIEEDILPSGFRRASWIPTSISRQFSNRNRVHTWPFSIRDHESTEVDQASDAEAATKSRDLEVDARSSVAGTERDRRRGSVDTRSSDPVKVHYSSKLEHSGFCFAHPHFFPIGSKNDQFLGEFDRLARDVKYEKGEGFPGLAWNRRDLGRTEFDWHSLTEMNLEDEEAGDQRNVCAKKVFDSCIGVPVMDEDNEVFAVLMIYSKEEKEFDVRKYSEDENTNYMLTSAAEFVRASLLMQEKQSIFGQAVKRRADSVDHTLSFDNKSDPLSGTSGFVRLALWLEEYFQKFKGQNATPPGGHGFEYVGLTIIGIFLSVLLISGIDQILVENAEFKDDQLFLLIGSFGAVATMLFSTPTSPLAQPRTIIGGHILSSVVALCLDYSLVIVPQWIANALAPALAAGLMTATGLIHPPAAACALIYVSGSARIKNLGWLFLLIPILVDAVLLVGLALVINNLAQKRKYPLFW